MKDLKITLVDPGTGERGFGTFGSSHWSSINHEGLCSLSASAKADGFKDIGLIDSRKLRNWSGFRKAFEAQAPDVVAFTMRSCDYNFVMKAVEAAKSIKKDIAVVVGGVHPTVATEEVARNDKIDHIITGEGEVSFVELLNDFVNKREAKRIIQRPLNTKKVIAG